jgi:hypothetical protein
MLRKYDDPRDKGEMHQDPPEPEPVAAAAAGSAHGVQHGETAVEPIPTRVSLRKPWPETVQVVMPYYKILPSQTLSTTSGIANAWRLNSIYDCETITTYSADPAAVADVADATINLPMWRNYWMTFYQYWSVVKTTWRIRLRCPNLSSVEEQTAYLYFHGLQRPPLQTTAGGYIYHEHRIQHPGVIWKHIRPKHDMYSFVGHEPHRFLWFEFNGTWTPGSIKHEVVEDELHQTWHKATEVPPTPEVMTLIVQPSAYNEEVEVGTNMRFIAEISLEYHVQLKDLKAAYQYVDHTTAIPGIAGIAAQVL